MYTTTLKIYKPNGDEFSKEDPVVCTVEGETITAAKAVDQEIWKAVSEHEELKDTPVEVDAVMVDDVEGDDQYEEDWSFVFFADVQENDDGSMDETGSTLTIRAYEENEPVSYFEPVMRVAYEEPGIVEPVPSDDGDDDGDTDVAPGPVEPDDVDGTVDDDSDDGDDSGNEEAPSEDDGIAVTSSKSKKSK